MQYLGIDALKRMASDFGLDNVNVVPNADKPLDTYLRARIEGRGLWRWCLILCLVMLLAETALIKFNFDRK